MEMKRRAKCDLKALWTQSASIRSAKKISPFYKCPSFFLVPLSFHSLIKDDGHDFHFSYSVLTTEKKSTQITIEWEVVTKGTYQIVITSRAAYSGMDECGSCVQLHRWS